MSDTEAQADRPAPTIAEVHRILLAEYGYWRDSPDPDGKPIDEIRIGAIGALANVIAAVTTGRLSPWQQRDCKPETEPTKASV